MKIYKFKDEIDGNFAFIIAKNEDEAAATLTITSSIPFKFIESKNIEEHNRPVILLNNILPF
ncbi:MULTISPECIES: hypothetical protein [unclassified Polaribacter]|uniref:hypothetical protein n=1 Tax=unclassified Polaribacter TaxID=196858 RepID=UPI0011BFB849|nr:MULTISPECIES: hypothetical protein [unclassified Polaribacter]TXD52706.1 hypothetical protein ES043_07665 [Polaribacter sp. IC063]TXD60674.1 hypothetical protein ES044_07195 [Polaribacter sp. IC066]